MTTLVMTITVADAGWRFTVAWTHELLQFIYPSTLFNIIIISISEMRKLWHRVKSCNVYQKRRQGTWRPGRTTPLPRPSLRQERPHSGGTGKLPLSAPPQEPHSDTSGLLT